MNPRVLVIGAYGNGNFGDDIVGHSIAAISTELSVVVKFAGRGKQVDSLHLPPGSIYVGSGLRSILTTSKLAASGEFKCAVLGGGGLLEGKRENVHVHRFILEYLSKLLVCRAFGIPIAVFGVGVSPDLYSSKLTSIATIRALKSCVGVSVRDKQSQQVLIAAGISAVLMQDPAVYILRSMLSHTNSRVGTKAYVFLDRHRWPDFTVKETQIESVRTEEIVQLVEKIRAEVAAGIEVSLLPFHYTDIPYINDVLRELGPDERAGVADVDYHGLDWKTAFSLLMSHESVETARFHPGLASLLAGSDVAVIGTLQKLEQLREIDRGNGPTAWSYPGTFSDPFDVLDGVYRAAKVR